MEEFFRIGCQVDEIKLMDLVMRRYHSLDCMKWLSVEQFARLILLALESEIKDHKRQEWCALLPMMCLPGSKYLSFEEYFDLVTGKNVDMRPVDVIMEEIDRKHAEAKAKVEKNGT